MPIYKMAMEEASCGADFPGRDMSGICPILWVLFAFVPFFHLALEALDIRPGKAFLHGKDAFALAPHPCTDSAHGVK